MALFSALKDNVRRNLGDQEISFYAAVEIDESFQDAYDDIIARSQCIVKKVTLAWVGGAVYLNFKDDYAVTDYIATTAIFDKVNNRWLRDDLSTRDFLKYRLDWELTVARPEF